MYPLPESGWVEQYQFSVQKDKTIYEFRISSRLRFHLSILSLQRSYIGILEKPPGNQGMSGPSVQGSKIFQSPSTVAVVEEVDPTRFQTFQKAAMGHGPKGAQRSAFPCEGAPLLLQPMKEIHVFEADF